jgi:uncharacterized protein (TIGR02646 family)
VIHIVKGRAPAVLRTDGKAARDLACAAHDGDPASYVSGAKKFDFDRAVYAAPAVKKALRRAQGDKCCFCEARLTHITAGDVEHFRPKAAYRQLPHDPLIRPGYYWLAYEWANLLLCCEICNRRGKANLFPLHNPASRATPHDRDDHAEQPLFIHPATEDPEEHIEFRDERACPRNGSRRGRVTIAALRLNRRELLRDRLQYLVLLRKLKETRNQLAGVVGSEKAATRSSRAKSESARLKELDAFFDELQRPSAEYAAMARAVLRR